MPYVNRRDQGLGGPKRGILGSQKWVKMGGPRKDAPEPASGQNGQNGGPKMTQKRAQKGPFGGEAGSIRGFLGGPKRGPKMGSQEPKTTVKMPSRGQKGGIYGVPQMGIWRGGGLWGVVLGNRVKIGQKGGQNGGPRGQKQEKTGSANGGGRLSNMQKGVLCGHHAVG